MVKAVKPRFGRSFFSASSLQDGGKLMRNAFVQDWRGFWAVGGLTGFMGRLFESSAVKLRPRPSAQRKTKYRDPSLRSG